MTRILQRFSVAAAVFAAWATAGCGKAENDNYMIGTSGTSTAEERAKPAPDYAATQEEYNKNIGSKAPSASFRQGYPFAKGANRKQAKGKEPRAPEASGR